MTENYNNTTIKNSFHFINIIHFSRKGLEYERKRK